MNIIEILKDFYRKLTKKDVDKLPVFYINGSQTLPPPLSSEEEMEVLLKINEKDSDFDRYNATACWLCFCQCRKRYNDRYD